VARPPRAVFVTLAVASVLPIALTGSTGAQAVPGRSQSDTTAPLVLPPAKTEGVAPTAAGIKAALSAAFSDPSLGPHHGVYVYDASRAKPLLSLNATTPYVPASTMKLLTTVSALETLGADHTFTTKAVSGAKGSVTLVGGGDPLLALRPGPSTDFPQRATLQELAAGTAKSLKAQGVTGVTLGYDASLFTGPAANANWEPNYLTEGIAARTSALWINEGRLSNGMAKRAPSPALAAATAFSGLLKKAGIKVTSAPKPVVAPSSATELAQVKSPTLGDIVEYINLHSDNDGAEVLLRQVGIATGNGGSYTGGVKGLRATLTKLGIDMSKATIYDGSGLSRSNHVPLEVLAGAVRMAVATPGLRHLLSGLPIAGFSGSLEDRFAGAGAGPGTGLVRAKTGTLTGVHSLAGYVRDRTGTLLVFAVATDSAPPAKALAARAALDRITAALANCGCSGP
jgi:D-alanyl-D-alanine carboxypeptidase/D-alanyl-D-alanine-endopeptidase (penicillin-binding protein 4)